MASAMRSTCSSLSITQGPAISASGLAPPNRIEGVTSISTCVLDVPQQRPGQTPLAILVRRPDEGPEQRMRLERLRLELGMELAAQIPRMTGNLADLDIRAVRRLARAPQPRRGQNIFIFAIELVAVPMPLADLGGSVGLVREAPFLQKTRPRPQPHGAAQLVDALELAKLVYDAVRRARVEFARIGALQAAHVARVLDYHGLHPQAD